ncbi:MULTISPECIES: hypothetical protein [unclassified Gilliamella]|uniref:hypothetical protein n=1 Tax=unclassified Gilliamella TaxID=2685620 RepID=UPI00080E0C03|nr:hypothetical protein [Gilliamella apicola]OCG21473.1 hypothetical protein A9G22_09635 [Gilliamella apicola]OCG22601.1 hypothetical protein A9G23_02920 [Gilliamella apicola]
MYNKFDVCISDFSHESEPGDYWYDCAILEATEILNKFNNNDWELLLAQLKFKPIFWQKRLVECLGDLHNSHELEVLLKIINTSNENLFISCIDSLRLLDLSNLDNSKKELLLLKIDILLQNASSPVKRVLEEFIKKLVE